MPDTGVILRSSINADNVSSSLLRRAEAGEIRLCVSEDLLAEVRDVLTRPEIRIKNARLNDGALEAFIGEIRANAALIDPLPPHVRYERDRDDEHVLNLAVEARAAYIVTFDNDLLDLMKAVGTAAMEFQKRYPTITILTPGELITRLNLLRQKVDPGATSSTEPIPEPEQPENKSL